MKKLTKQEQNEWQNYHDNPDNWYIPRVKRMFGFILWCRIRLFFMPLIGEIYTCDNNGQNTVRQELDLRRHGYIMAHYNPNQGLFQSCYSHLEGIATWTNGKNKIYNYHHYIDAEVKNCCTTEEKLSFTFPRDSK